MSTQVQHRRGTAAQHEAFTGAMSEITHDTTNNNIRVHDGQKPGGYATLMENQFGVANGVATLDSTGNVPEDQLGNVPSVSNYAAIDIVQSAIIGEEVTYLRTAGYTVAGDGGNALYRRKGSAEADAYGDITSNSGAVRWGLVGNEFRLKQFGAVEGQDVAGIIEGALSLGKKLIVDGIYTASHEITYAGGVHIVAASDKSEIHWPADAASGGFNLTATDWYDYFEIAHVRLTTAAVALWNAVAIDWYDLGTSNIPYFWVRGRIHHNRIMGALTAGGDNDTSVGWLNGVYLNYPFSVEVMDNYIFGAWDGTYNTNGIDAFKSHAGIYVPDQSQRTAAYLRMERNSLFYSQYGVLQYNIEGTWFIDNDIQVTWFGLWYENTIVPVNQHRMFGNHIGVYDSHIVVINARQVLIEHNEISYRIGRTDGGASPLITLDGVYSGAIVGNSIRGNVQNTTDVIVTGILLINNSREVGNTRRISIDANQFQNLAYAYQIRASAINNNIGPSNTYDNMMSGVGVTVDNTAIAPGVMGSGTISLPAGQGPALYLRSKAAGSFALGREGVTGTAQTFFYNGVSVGTIAVSESSTAYNTTSDATVKIDKGELSVTDAVNIVRLITIHNYDWTATGQSDIGAFAQELYEVYPLAVFKGGWFLPDDDGTDVPEGTEGAYYRPWMVDYSKLIPVILRALQSVLP